MTTNSSFPSPSLRLFRYALAVALLSAAPLTQAAWRFGDSSPDGVSSGTTPELALIIWDPVKEVSYTKDLGIDVYGVNYALGDTSSNLFVYGQQDAGYQKLFNPLNTDPNFTAFLAKSTDITNQIWMVVSVSTNPNGVFEAESHSLYTTLNAQTPTGTLNPEYTKLLNWFNGDMSSAADSFSSFFPNTNKQDGTCSNSCFTDYAANLSYLNVKGKDGYAGSVFSSAHGFDGYASSPNFFNPVNSSSWFYKATTTSDNSTEVIVVDEFDNLSHDAYWGLGVAANGDYILSYTLDAAITPTSTAAGALLRLRTDFAASYGRTRLINAPVGDSLGLGAPVAAVPEPSTWGLMGLGLMLLAVRARRRRA